MNGVGFLKEGIKGWWYGFGLGFWGGSMVDMVCCYKVMLLFDIVGGVVCYSWVWWVVLCFFIYLSC